MRYASFDVSRSTTILVLLLLLPFSVWWLAHSQGVVHAGAEAPEGWSGVLRHDQGTGIVAGRVLVDEGVPVEDVELLLQAQLDGHGQAVLGQLPLTVGPDGRFESPYLPPGTATVVARVGGEELVRLEDVRIPAQGYADDPRLAELDLRGALSLFEFTVYDVNGDPVPQALVGWRPSSPEGEPAPYARAAVALEGRAEVLCAGSYLDVLVVAHGARTQEFLGVAFGRELHLREGWRVRLALPEDVRPAEDGVDLVARLVRAAPDPRVDPAATLLLDATGEVPEVTFEGGEAEVWLPAQGAWEVEWIALRDTRVGLSRLDLGRERPVFEVRPGSWREAVRPTFPVAAYRAALGE